MTLILTRPTNGQPFGPGMAITGSGTVVMPAGGRWHGFIQSPSGVGFSSEWIAAAPLLSFDGTFGLNEATGAYAVYRQLSDLTHGSAAVLHVDQIRFDGVILDSVAVSIVYDLLAGVEFLVGWAATHLTGGGTGGGFTQADRDLLNNVYAAVHHVFPPS